MESWEFGNKIHVFPHCFTESPGSLYEVASSSLDERLWFIKSRVEWISVIMKMVVWELFGSRENLYFSESLKLRHEDPALGSMAPWKKNGI